MCLKYVVDRNQKKKVESSRDDTERTEESAERVSYCLVCDKQYYLDMLSV